MIMGAVVVAGATVMAQTVEERLTKLEEDAQYAKLQAGANTKAVEGQDKQLLAMQKAFDRIKFYGDVRVRYEHEDGKRKETTNQTRDRLRFRARLNMDATLDSEWMTSMQIGTNPGDPTSGNASFGEGFAAPGGSAKIVGFERAFLRYTPEELGKQVRFTAGKMGQPWISVSDLVYDSSVNPEGVAAVGEFKFDGVTFYVNGGFFQPMGTFNDNAATTPVRLYSAQVATKVAVDEYSFLVGASTYIWDSLRGKAPRTFLWSQGGAVNVNNGGADFDVNRYDEVELFAAIDAKFAIPFGIYGQFVNNAKGEVDKNGYLVGVKVGKADHGKLELSYDYRFVGRDSVLSAYSEGSLWGGGTDGKGHRVQLRYGLTRAVQLGLTGFFTKADISGTQPDNAYSGDYKRFQFDVAARF